MLKRCYSEKELVKRPSYSDCYVCEEWLTFSNFKKWMEAQDFHGKQLDKDILLLGNKIYSPETCCFVTQRVNSFVISRRAKISDLPIGVCLHKRIKKYSATCNNFLASKIDHIGYYDNPEDAHCAWRKRKDLYAKMLSFEIKDKKISKAIFDMFSDKNAQFWRCM
jgi:hypothetical protein